MVQNDEFEVVLKASWLVHECDQDIYILHELILRLVGLVVSLLLFEKLLLDLRVGVQVVLVDVPFYLVVNFLGLKEFIHQHVVALVAAHLQQVVG